MSATISGKRTLRGALVSLSASGAEKAFIFQYNPATMQRSLTPNMAGGEEQDRSMTVIFKGPPSQTIEISVELDASTGLDRGSEQAGEWGVYAQLAALELLAAPNVATINDMQHKLEKGHMEVAPMSAPPLYLVWGKSRILPVRITQFSVTEEMFDAHLNPIRVTVALSMRVLNTSDVMVSNKAYHQYIAYQQNMEKIASSTYGKIDYLSNGIK